MTLTLSDGSGLGLGELVTLYEEISGWLTNGQVTFSTRFNIVAYVFTPSEVTTLTNLQASLKILISSNVTASKI